MPTHTQQSAPIRTYRLYLTVQDGLELNAFLPYPLHRINTLHQPRLNLIKVIHPLRAPVCHGNVTWLSITGCDQIRPLERTEGEGSERSVVNKRIKNIERGRDVPSYHACMFWSQRKILVESSSRTPVWNFTRQQGLG